MIARPDTNQFAAKRAERHLETFHKRFCETEPALTALQAPMTANKSWNHRGSVHAPFLEQAPHLRQLENQHHRDGSSNVKPYATLEGDHFAGQPTG
jgi:hypothetical protein